MFTGLYPLFSQDSFTPVSLTFWCSFTGERAGSKLSAQVADLFSIKKEEKATKLLCVEELSGTAQKPHACRVHCRCREGMEIGSPRQWAASAFGEGLRFWFVLGRQEGCELCWGVISIPLERQGLTQVRLSWSLAEAPNLLQADRKCLCSCWWPQSWDLGFVLLSKW